MPVPSGFVQASYRWLVSGSVREMVNVVGHELPEGVVLTPNGIAEALYDFWQLNLKAQQSTVISFTGVTVRIGTGSDDLLGQHNELIAGTSGLLPASVNCAALVTKTTALGGRRNRGRMYLPGFVDEGSLGPAGFIAAAEATSIQDAMDDWYDALVAAEYRPVILHSDASTPTPVTGFQVSNVIATQRRRVRP